MAITISCIERFAFGATIKLFVDVPPVDEWEARTLTPLSRRDEILTFVATAFKQQKGLGWQFEIDDRQIAFY